MFQENEIVMLVLGAGVLVFILWKRTRLKRIPASKVLISGFCVLLAGWVATVLEGVLWGSYLNVLDHLCYAGSSVLLAIWCGMALRGEERPR